MVFLGNFPLWNLEFSAKFSWIGFESGKEIPPDGAGKGRLSESHIYARMWKNFLKFDITYNTYAVSHIRVDASTPDPATAGHHLEKKSLYTHTICASPMIFLRKSQKKSRQQKGNKKQTAPV